MELLILFLLILLNGVFAMSEIAVVSIRRSKLETTARKGDVRAQRALELSQNPNRFLSTVQIGITLVGILTGVYSGDKISDQLKVYIDQILLLQPYSELLSVLIVVVFITFLSLVFGELVPKRIGLNNPENIARVVARPMSILSAVSTPFIWVLTSSSDLVMRLLGMNKKKEEIVTEEEIKVVVQEGVKSGSIEKIERNIVERVFHLGDRSVASLMTPSVDLVWLDLHDAVEVNKEKIKISGHSVFPVCDKNLDHVKGVVSIKDLLKSSFEEKEFNLILNTSAPFYVSESMEAYQLLAKFKESRKHFALVTNEFGAVTGAVTLNDLMKVLLGSISDIKEHEHEMIKREDGSYLLDATMAIHDFINYFNIEDRELSETDDFHSLGGFVLVHAKAIPKPGFKFVWKNYTFEVIDMDGIRIDKVLVTKIK